MERNGTEKYSDEITIESILDNIKGRYEVGLLDVSEYRGSLRTISNMVNKRLDVLAGDELKRWDQRPNQYDEFIKNFNE
tara:strand:+ start:820 stop:1056 length:237 start_codon:yes stop_codon:yes gene_type:complete